MNALESGKIHLTWSDVNLSTLVDVLIQEYRARAEAKHIVLHQNIPSDPIIIRTDSAIIHQILDNLISNAVKYSPHHKEIVLRLHHIHHHESEYLRIEVQDQGSGLSEDDQQRLFGKFARLSAQPTGGKHSTGLGLSIVKKITTMIGGKIWCESQLGKGATFIVELPMTPTT